MRNNKILFFISIILLGAAVILMLLRSFDTDDGRSGKPEESRGAERPDDAMGSYLGEARSESTADLHRSKSDTRSPTTNISGLGELPYNEVKRHMDLNQILLRCGIITEGDYEMNLKTGRKATADVYLNEKGEIVHISFQKGLYKTKSRDAEVMADFGSTNSPPHGRIAIVSIGVPGLTLENTEMLKSFLTHGTIQSTVNSDGRFELEVTPVIGEVTGVYTRRPDYIGRRFPMILKKCASGMPTSDAFIDGYQDYRREELIRREWTLAPFLADPLADDKRIPAISDGGVYDEPLLEAWERRQAGSSGKEEKGAN